MITTVGLELGSVPGARERWRIVVRATGVFVNGAQLGQRWYDGTGSGYFGTFADNGLATLQLGFPISAPASSGDYFCMDVQFASVPPGLNLTQLAEAWTSRLGGQVVRVKRIPGGETSTAATRDRSAQLEAAIEDAPRGSGERILETGERALDALQLAFWAVIIGGLAYLFVKARNK